MEELLFEVLTPLKFTVRVTRDYWKIITTIKHPIMLNCEAEVHETLAQPDEIRRSKSDHDVYLFYRARNEKCWICG